MLWSLQSHYDFIMSWQLHLVLGDAANTSKQPFIKTNSNATSFRSEMEDLVTVRQCKSATVSFERADIWMEAAKRWSKEKDAAQQHKKWPEGWLLCYFHPRHSRQRWASKLWKGCGSVERVNCLNSVSARATPSYPTFESSFPVKIVQHCSFEKKISWC